MKRIFLALLFSIISSYIYSQDLSVIYSLFVDLNPKDTVECDLTIWKHVENNYIVKNKHFRNRTMISLSEGTYTIQYKVNSKVIHTYKFSLEKEPSVIVVNLLQKPVPLEEFDFNNVYFLDPAAVDLATRKIIYIEF